MTNNSTETHNLSIENNLSLTGLYSNGIYIVKEKLKYELSFEGLYEQKVLNVFMSQASVHPTIMQMGSLLKLLTALKVNGEFISPSGFALLNVGALNPKQSLEEILIKLSPQKTIIWADTWTDESLEILYYKTAKIGDTDFIRCPSFKTVVSDPERKKACWTALTNYFAS